MYSKTVALVLGIISFVPPFNGLLRYYLKRHATGTVYTLTSGLFFIGNILDVVQIPQLVKRANMDLKRREMRRLDVFDEDFEQPREIEHRDRGGVIEKQILRSAKSNKGYTTPSEVALESEVSIEEAQQALDYLVSKGFAEMKVSKSGTIVYYFPDILTSDSPDTFEDV